MYKLYKDKLWKQVKDHKYVQLTILVSQMCLVVLYPTPHSSGKACCGLVEQSR
jgi:hypothetical protein